MADWSRARGACPGPGHTRRRRCQPAADTSRQSRRRWCGRARSRAPRRRRTRTRQGATRPRSCLTWIALAERPLDEAQDPFLSLAPEIGAAVHRSARVHARSPDAGLPLHLVGKGAEGRALRIEGVAELVRDPAPAEVDRELVHGNVLVGVAIVVNLVHLEKLTRADRHAPADLLLERVVAHEARAA